MKKARVCRVLGIVIALAVIFLIIFWNMNRMKGNIFVTINGEECQLTDLACNYIGTDKEEKISYKTNSSGMIALILSCSMP